MCIRDRYVSGSDQLWNYKHNEGNDKHYFFDGIEGVKIAYASSIGMESLPEDYADVYKRQCLLHAQRRPCFIRNVNSFFGFIRIDNHYVYI